MTYDRKSKEENLPFIILHGMIFLVEIFPDVFNGFLQTGLSRLMRVELGNKTKES